MFIFYAARVCARAKTHSNGKGKNWEKKLKWKHKINEIEYNETNDIMLET